MTATRNKPDKKDQEGRPALAAQIHPEGPDTQAQHDAEDHQPPDQTHQPGPEHDVHQADGRDKTVFQTFAPDIIEQGVGHVQLGDLHRVHGHRPDEHKGDRLRTQLQKTGEQPHGKQTHQGPEQHFKDRKDIAAVHNAAPGGKSPDFDRLSD